MHPAIDDKFIDAMFADIYRHSLTSDRYLSLQPHEQVEVSANGRRSIVAQIERTIERIEAKDIQLYKACAFQPDNKWSRKILLLVAGIELPRGKLDTQEVIRKWIGEPALQAHADALQAERDAKKAAQEAKNIAILDRIAARIASGEQVSGGELVDCARYHGIEVHPRTAGTLMARVVAINADTARIRPTKTGKGKLSNEPYKLYSWCAELIAAKQEQPAHV